MSIRCSLSCFSHGLKPRIVRGLYRFDRQRAVANLPGQQWGCCQFQSKRHIGGSPVDGQAQPFATHLECNRRLRGGKASPLNFRLVSFALLERLLDSITDEVRLLFALD